MSNVCVILDCPRFAERGFYTCRQHHGVLASEQREREEVRADAAARSLTGCNPVPKTATLDPLYNDAFDYYTQGGIDVTAIIEAWKLPFHLGVALQYILRAGKKTQDPLRDLQKARWYLDRYIKRLEEDK